VSRQRGRTPLPERCLVARRDLGPLFDGRFQAVELVGRGVGPESNAVDGSPGGIGRERGTDLRENLWQTIQWDEGALQAQESGHFTGFGRENRTIQVSRLSETPAALEIEGAGEGFALSPDSSRDREDEYQQREQ